jgi:hypothetical protein
MAAEKTYAELVTETAKTAPKSKVTLTRGHYPMPPNRGGYLASVGGIERLWFGYWAPRSTNGDFFASKYVALGWLQVAQACLNNPAFPTSEAVYALREFSAFYRHHAYRQRNCGSARDSVDIAAYLVSTSATRDGQAFLRSGLRQEEDTKRRAFALKVLRAAACDLARYLEDAETKPISTAFRVPYLPLNWRTNPYYSDWDTMPFGFSRPIWVNEMREQGIVNTMYAFSGKDPVTQRWVFKPVDEPWYEDMGDAIGDFFEDIGDDIGDFFKKVGEFFEKYIKEIADWICENQAVIAGAIAAIVTAVEVGVACVGTVGTACPAALAAAPAAAAAQYAAIAEPLAASCGAYAGVKLAAGVAAIEDRIKVAAERAVESNGVVIAAKQDVRAVEKKVRGAIRKVEEVKADIEREVRRVLTSAIREIRDTIKGIVEPLVEKVKKFALDILRDMRNATASGVSATSAGIQGAGIAAEKAVEKYLDFDFIADYFYDKAEDHARKMLRPLVEAKVRVVSGLTPDTSKATGGDLMSIDLMVRVATRSPDEAQKRSARQSVESDKNRKTGAYLGVPKVAFSPVEQAAPVFLGLFVGMPEDAINEVLFSRGPVVGSASIPTLSEVRAAMTAKAVDASMEFPVFLGPFDPAKTSFPVAFNVRRDLEAARGRLLAARLAQSGQQGQMNIRAVPAKTNVFPAGMLRQGAGSGGPFFGFGGEQMMLRQDIGNDVTRRAYAAILTEEGRLLRRMSEQRTITLMISVAIQQTNANIAAATKIERDLKAKQDQAARQHQQQQKRQQEDRMIASVKSRYSKTKSKTSGGGGLLLIGAAAAAAFYIS